MTLDTQLFFALNSMAGQSRLLDNAIVFFASDLAYALIALFLIVVWLSTYPNRKKVEWLIVTGVSTLVARFGVTELIRFFYHRPRPFMTFHVYQLLPETSWSFPSGHATFFFAMATTVYLYDKKWGVVFFVATVLMTACRVAAGVHYPSDILGGAVLGALVAWVTYLVVRKVAEK